MSGADAAAYLGISTATFAAWVADGRAPKPLPGTRRWDRRALDLSIDRASGFAIAPVVPADDDPFAVWEAKYEARKATIADGDFGTPYYWKKDFDAAWAEWLVEHESWKATQSPSNRWSLGDIEETRRRLWTVWKNLKGTRLAVTSSRSR